MAQVIVRENESLESALKRFKLITKTEMRTSFYRFAFFLTG